MSTRLLGTFHCIHGNYGEPSEPVSVEVFRTLALAESTLKQMYESNGWESVRQQHADGTQSDTVFPLVGSGDFYRIYPVDEELVQHNGDDSLEFFVTQAEAILADGSSPSHILTIGPQGGIQVEIQ